MSHPPSSIDTTRPEAQTLGMLDRPIRPSHAIAVAVLVVAVAAFLAPDAASFGRVLFRTAFVGVLLLPVVGWGLEKGRQWWDRRREARTTDTPTPHARLGRLEFYAALVAVLLIAAMFASSRRYVVELHRVDDTLVYQRTDRFTGRAEIWIPASNLPRPDWLSVRAAVR